MSFPSDSFGLSIFQAAQALSAASGRWARLRVSPRGPYCLSTLGEDCPRESGQFQELPEAVSSRSFLVLRSFAAVFHLPLESLLFHFPGNIVCLKRLNLKENCYTIQTHHWLPAELPRKSFSSRFEGLVPVINLVLFRVLHSRPSASALQQL